ncbi:MAG: molecular chaperone DnaJ [Methanobacteriota archaeon]|jgi:molecular chaperone DnaJ|nr:MAG: molecular chaperone DnaJ [Euryarchaeota archaeon]
MAKKDYYEILDVPKDSDERTIKKAYRKLARKHHPDASEESPEIAEKKFKEVSEAYEVLADKEKRERYDQYGHKGVDFGGGGFSWDQFSHGGDVSDLFGQLFGGGQRRGGGVGDVFSQLFGGGQRRPDNRGDDLRYDITLTLEEAYKGIEKEVVIPRNGNCKKCSGSGAANGGTAKTCGTCGGQGIVRRMKQRSFMQTITTDNCSDCRGSGKLIDKPCRNCRGSGIMAINKKIKLRIPPGADHGFRLRMRGQGSAGPNNGQKGDLYIIVNLKKHELFQRQENEIILDLEITPAQAVIGDDMRVPTLSGNVKLKIPSGTQSGDILRLKGKGMTDITRPTLKGSQHIRINVKVPKPNGKTRKLWEELKKLDSEKPSFLDRMRNKFG